MPGTSDSKTGAKSYTSLTTHNISFSYPPIDEIFTADSTALFGASMPTLQRSVPVEVRTIDAATAVRFNMTNHESYVHFRAVWRIHANEAGNKAVKDIFDLVRKYQNEAAYDNATITLFQEDGEEIDQSRDIHGCSVHGVKLRIDKQRDIFALDVQFHGLYEATGTS